MMEQQEMTREEAVKAITSYGNDAYTARGLEPGAKYWAVARYRCRRTHDDEAYRRSFYSADCTRIHQYIRNRNDSNHTDRSIDYRYTVEQRCLLPGCSVG